MAARSHVESSHAPPGYGLGQSAVITPGAQAGVAGVDGVLGGVVGVLGEDGLVDGVVGAVVVGAALVVGAAVVDGAVGDTVADAPGKPVICCLLASAVLGALAR